VRALFCTLLCVLAALTPVDARPPARTPADVERRRAEIVERLAAIEVELAAADERLTGLPARVADAEGDARAALEAEQRTLLARRGALLDERAALHKEQAELASLRTRTATGPLQPQDPQGLSPLDLGGQNAQVSSGQSFNPAISVIPDIAYYNDDVAGAAFEMVEDVDAFGGGSVEADPGGHGHGALERGFNLREMEVAFSGAVDPYFDVWAVLAIAPDEIGAEEVYVQTRKFLPGVQLRVGKFFSGVGHVNKQHPHQWDFVDQALPLQAMFGGTLVDTGLQATWLPNLPVYTLLGFEALQGDNARLSYNAADAHPDLFEETPGPRLFTGFVKVSPDLGYGHALQGGMSFGRSRSHQEIVTGADGAPSGGLEGNTWFVGTDWVWRYDSPRQLGRGDLTVQGEYLYRQKDLAATRDLGAIGAGTPVVSAQDGLYAQAVYGIASRWTLAARVDVVGLTNRVDTGGTVEEYERSQRYTAAITFNPTEFSRLRVQYENGRAWNDRQSVPFQQVFVQFQMSLGVHGAHRF
jgi:hypothetical protein